MCNKKIIQNKHYQKYKDRYVKEQRDKYNSLDKFECICGNSIHPKFLHNHVETKLHKKKLDKINPLLIIDLS